MRLFKLVITFMVLLSFILFSSVYVDAATVTMSATPTVLYKSSLNGASITLVISGTDFRQGAADIVPSNFRLNNAPSGLTIASVSAGSDVKTALVVLAFNGTYFVGDITNFSVTALPAVIKDGSNVTSNTITIKDDGIPITMTAAPNPLSENALNGAAIKLVVSGTDFKQGSSLVTSNFVLNNAPSGLVISGVFSSTDTKTVLVVLAFDGTNFDGNITNFSVTVLPGGTASGTTVTSNTIIIKDIKFVEGTGDTIVTGESYPTKIETAGYNVRDGYFYLNVDLYTIKAVSTTQNTTFSYYVKFYDQTSNEIGQYGNFSSPMVVSTTGSNTVSIKNIKISVPNLPAGYRIVVTVKSVSIN